MDCPDLLSLHQLHPERYPCLLESVSHGTPRARYDILFVSSGAHLTLHRPDRLEAHRAPEVSGTDFLENLDRWWRREHRGQVEPGRLPFHGGWFVFLGYELVAQIERRLVLPAAEDPAPPLATAVRCPAAVIRDHALGQTCLVAEPGHEALLETIRDDLSRAGAGMPAAPPAPAQALTEDDPARFLRGVARIKHYITEGDVFQVNLSRAWHGRLAPGTASAAIYRRLRESNPAPFAGIAQIGDTAIISSSPERLVCVRDRLIETRPIAGTRPRGRDSDVDVDYSRRLLRHPKERAEHIMLIDLERNDLGRVCRPGTVEVDELMALESYAHVHHIVSNVRGVLAPGVTPGAVVRAVFPGGTITGCPKVRCMEIIAELEETARGPYTGALGYIGRNGDMDFNILIRSLVRTGDRLSLRAGAGIVADSVPEKELAETRHKARGLLRVFSEA